MAEGEDVIAPCQPAFDQLTQDAFAARGAVAAAMNDAYAAFVGVVRFGEKTGDFFVCFVAVEAVQIGVVLDSPASAAQVAQDVRGSPGRRKVSASPMARMASMSKGL